MYGVVSLAFYNQRLENAQPSTQHCHNNTVKLFYNGWETIGDCTNMMKYSCFRGNNNKMPYQKNRSYVKCAAAVHLAE